MDGPNAALIESLALSLHERRPRTVEVYLRDIDAFARWHDGDLLAVTRADIQRWIAWQQSKGLLGNTIRSRFIALRVLYGWALDEGEIDTNPTDRITVRRSDEPPPAVLAPAELAALLKACTGTHFLDRRDLALIRMMVASGLRVSEAMSIDLADLDLTARRADVRDGKGGRSRVVRFDPTTAATLDRYKRVRARHRHGTLPNLWIGERGPLRPKAVAALLRKRAAIAGIGHVHPHQLRHTWAHRWLESGGEEGDLQELGGWESPAVMRRYGAGRARDRALGAYDRIDPMRGL